MPGELRYWWIVVKLALTVALLIFTPVWLGGWVNEAIAATATGAPGPAYATVPADLLAGSVSVLTTLVVVVSVSVVKPWGRIRRGPLRAGPQAPRRLPATVSPRAWD